MPSGALHGERDHTDLTLSDQVKHLESIANRRRLEIIDLKRERDDLQRRFNAATSRIMREIVDEVLRKSAEEGT